MAGLRGTLRRTRWRFGLVTSGIAVLLAGVGLVNAGAAHAAAGCRVVYSAPSQWPGGFTANVDLTNLGDAVNGWRLTWTFPSGQRVTQAWNATVTSAGNDVTATNVGYNAALGTNQSVSFGFNGTYTGTSNTAPTSFALNGVTCTGSVGPTTPPPTTPPPTTPPPTT
ncbi:cellulase, partial [Verrucosispora sp. SN26_14.1]